MIQILSRVVDKSCLALQWILFPDIPSSFAVVILQCIARFSPKISPYLEFLWWKAFQPQSTMYVPRNNPSSGEQCTRNIVSYKSFLKWRRLAFYNCNKWKPKGCNARNLLRRLYMMSVNINYEQNLYYGYKWVWAHFLYDTHHGSHSHKTLK